MKTNKNQNTPTKIKCILAAVLLFLTLLLFGNVLIIGEHLQNSHPLLGWLFYALVAAGFIWLILSPLWEYLHLPVFPASVITDCETPPSYKICQRITRGLVRSEALTPEQQAQLQLALEQKSDLFPLLQEAFNGPVQKALEDKTYHTARGVFIACAVSQSTLLDAFIVLASNIKLIQQLIRITGYRPSWPQIGKLYLNIFLTALLVEALEDIDPGDFFASLNTTPNIPGLNLAAQSLLHGIGCTFFTLRIGLITQNYLYQAPIHRENNQLRRSAFHKALPLLKKIVTENIRQLPQEAKTLFEKYIF